MMIVMFLFDERFSDSNQSCVKDKRDCPIIMLLDLYHV
jgi:hypothetical protein